MSHSRLEPIVELPHVTAVSTTLFALLAIAQERLGEEVVLEFDGEVVTAMHCNTCNTDEPIFKRMARLYENEATCPTCNGRRDMILTHRITGSEPYLNRTLAEMDMPPLGIVQARNGQEKVYLEFTGDKESFLKFE